MKKIVSILIVLTMILSSTVCLSGCEAGEQGPKGEQGIQGDKGDKGDQGEQGIQGDKGDKGDQGEQGEQGIQGDKGDKGDQGEQGIQGDKGDKGDQGEQGIQGEKGDKGDQGATISKVEFDDLGRLIITLTDGTVLDPVEIPEKQEHQHSFIEWITMKKQSCTSDGYQLRACTECNYTEMQILTRLDHEGVVLPAREPTCTVDGLTAGVLCINCLKSTQEVIPATGHVMISEHYEWPSDCTNCGYISEEKCTACGYRPLVSKTTPPLGHDLDENGTCKTCGTGIGDYWDRVMIDNEGQGKMSFENLYQHSIDNADPDVILPLEYYNGSKINSKLYFDTFAHCEWVTAITIPEYYTEIGGEFAYSCNNLKYIYIPSTVSYIEWVPGSDCPNLEIIHYGGTVKSWINSVWWKTGGFWFYNESCIIYCSDGTVNPYTGEIIYYS